MTPTAPSALPALNSEDNATIHILGTEFVHFYLLEEDGETDSLASCRAPTESPSTSTVQTATGRGRERRSRPRAHP